MDFTLTKEQILMQELYRKFAETEVKPLAEIIDEEERFPEENLKKFAACGFMGIPFPKEYGGQGADNLAYSMCIEEMAKVCATSAVIISAHTSLCCQPIFQFGTEEQKQKYLVPLAKGEKLGAFGLTEPGAGTDSSMQQTTAVLDGDEYVLNGTKVFITNGGYADIYVVIAMTDKSKGNRGISAFIVEKGTEGFKFGKKERKMGIKGSATCDLIFENCRIPKENLLGKEGQGFKVAMQTLDGGRIGIASQALGIAEGALNECIAYTKERKQFGKTIAQFQNTQFEIAEMAAKIESCQLLLRKAASEKDAHRPYGHLSAMVKLLCAELASDVTRRCLQLFGGYGYTRDYPMERMMRDAKITEIYEGTSEVQKIVIANWLKLGK